MKNLTRSQHVNFLSKEILFDKITKINKLKMLYLFLKFESRLQNRTYSSEQMIKSFKTKDEMLKKILISTEWLKNGKVKSNLWIEVYKSRNEDFTTQLKVFKKCKEYGLTFSLVCNEPVMDFTTQYLFWCGIKKDLDLICKTLGLDFYKFKTPEKVSPIIKKVLIQNYWKYKNSLKKMSERFEKAIEQAQHLKQGIENEFVFCDKMQNQEMWKTYFKNNRVENS